MNTYPTKTHLFSLIIILLISQVLFTSCVTSNGFKKFYEPFRESKDSNDLILLARNESPKVYYSDNLDEDIEDLMSRNYVILGVSVFIGPLDDDNDVLEVAKQVGATIILINQSYSNTVSSTFSIPTYQTTYASGTYNSSLGYYSGTATTYGSSNALFTAHADRYSQTAVFLAKSAKEYKYGLLVDDLTPNERVYYERNTGAVVRLVYEDTPAFYANIIKGDLIISINDRRVGNAYQAVLEMDNISQIASTAKFLIVRNGIEREVILEF